LGATIEESKEVSDLPINPSEATKRRNPHLFTAIGIEIMRRAQSNAMEEDIHDDIERLCRSRGWLYVHSRMDKRTTVHVGTPDFIIALPGGRTLWIECKRKDGKLTEKQHGTLRWLRKLGQEAHVATDVEQVKHLAETGPGTKERGNQ
jgi:hypothetical protein